MAQGSGFIISADGYVVTNNHVVQNATDVTARPRRRAQPDGQGHRHRREDRPRAAQDRRAGKLSRSSNWPTAFPRIGDWVLAVGNPFGLGGTVTAGIVSARGRDIGAGPYDDFMQIDAPVNRGNSGGPTFDLHGRRGRRQHRDLSRPVGGSVGIGFAIPAERRQRRDRAIARRWLGHARLHRRADPGDHPGDRRLASDLRSNNGALVAEPQANTPAAKAGLRSGDVIVSVDGARVESPRELSRRIASLGPKRQTQIGFLREGREQTVDRAARSAARAQPQTRAAPAPARASRMLTARASDFAWRPAPMGSRSRKSNPAAPPRAPDCAKAT